MFMNISEKLPSNLELVPSFISSWMPLIKQEAKVGEDLEFEIRLILEEAMTNAIKHGNKMNQRLFIQVNITLENDQLVIDIKDQGNGFDFKNVPNPTRDDKLMATSGRGVFLIHKFVDEVNFYDAGRGIRMRKVLHPK